jgi:glycolate oxidase
MALTEKTTDRSYDVAALAADLRQALGARNVLDQPHQTMLYESDGSTDRHPCDIVATPESTGQVAELVRICRRHHVPIVARGAGTSLSGTAVPAEAGVVVSTARMDRILKIDPLSRTAVVQPGVVQLDISHAAAEFGLYYAPDPSSQKSCTIGGNVGTNAGGAHTLAYGVTSNHVLALEWVDADGAVATMHASREAPGYDLTGLLIGSEGTLAFVTEITVGLLRLPESTRTLLASFETVTAACRVVSEIIGAGIIPAACELMDQPCAQAVAGWVPSAGIPQNAGAVMVVEVEGIDAGLDEDAAAIEQICRASDGLIEIRRAADESEREDLWKARKGAFGAIGVLAPDYYVQDGVVPRTRLPEVLDEVAAIGKRYGLRIMNVFHAGDGNIHPTVLFDRAADPDSLGRVKAAGADILQVCMEVGGTLTGEHGLGMEKNMLLGELLDPPSLEAMVKVRDAFAPHRLLNPSKLLPLPLSRSDLADYRPSNRAARAASYSSG